ncbi:hypothetical protein CVD28_01055 [Bacillus sp. M6-12]|uniref:hypothetical protein n=1 Tax=Bacillus sp. M6-12 TaxID=2054166 RepID=UPI000C772FBA|nr:hypothetical protein [Bacillus sp. M6-12]PLS19022.1 hypothetical protein CVD28_01055 [Bacillus sp. M6-12]
MKKGQNVTTLEEAIVFCQENFATIQFEFNPEDDLNDVVVSTNPFKRYTAKNLMDAVNLLVKDILKQQKELDKKIEYTEEQYNRDLYCMECGEDDIKNLSYEANYGGWEKWNCKCGHGFQIKALPSE